MSNWCITCLKPGSNLEDAYNYKIKANDVQLYTINKEQLINLSSLLDNYDFDTPDFAHRKLEMCSDCLTKLHDCVFFKNKALKSLHELKGMRVKIEHMATDIADTVKTEPIFDDDDADVDFDNEKSAAAIENDQLSVKVLLEKNRDYEIEIPVVNIKREADISYDKSEINAELLSSNPNTMQSVQNKDYLMLFRQTDDLNQSVQAKSLPKRTPIPMELRVTSGPSTCQNVQKKLIINQVVKKKNHIDTSNPDWEIKVLSLEEMMQRIQQRRESAAFLNSKYRCILCVAVFTNQKNMEDHMVACHTATLGNAVCCLCTRRFPNQGILNTHMHVHSPLQCTCRTCGYQTDCPRTDHDCNSTEKIDPLEAEPTTGSSTKSSKTKAPKRRTFNILSYKASVCKHCGEAMKNYKEYMLHVKTNHKEALLHCKECNKEFCHKGHLTGHMRMHGAQYNWFKKKTSSKVNKKISSKAHKKVDKKAKREWHACDRCDKKFLLPSSLKLHIRVRHLAEKPFKCPQCETTFSTRTVRTKHMRNEHGMTVTCEPRSHVCETCGAAFQLKKVLEQHMNKHTGARPYKCKVCPATFSYSGACYTHTKLKHKVPEKSFKQSSDTPQVVEVKKKRKKAG